MKETNRPRCVKWMFMLFILQIAMNVPNGNWNFYEHIVLEREDDLLSLMNIESCYCMS